MTTVLVVLSSHDRIGTSPYSGGNWLDTFATPYFILRDAGVRVTVVTPAGGDVRFDPRSGRDGSMTDAVRRLRADDEARFAVSSTQRLEDVDPSVFDCLFYPGSYPMLTDVVPHPASIRAIEEADAAARPIGMVCHGPGALHPARRADGSPLVEGRHVTGLSRSEETGIGMIDYVPLVVEDALVAAGGVYTSGEDWTPYVVSDGNLVTGQNPASSAGVARQLLDRL